jgi:cytochrome b561
VCGHHSVTRIVHLLTLLAVNAIPAVGWFGRDWSPGTTLTVYWFENVAVCLFVSAQVVIHQRWSPRRGHFRYQAPSAQRGASRTSLVQGFLVTSLAFCAAHGIFLGAIVFLLNRNGERYLADVDWRSVGFGCMSVVVVLVVDFVADLFSLRQWSFLQLEQTAYRGLGRVVVVHLTLVIGLFAVAISGAPSTLFGVFVVFKTLYALSTAVPQREPAGPPKRLSRLMNRLPKVRLGQGFEEQWLKDQAAEAQRRDRNEDPWAGTRR